jgi:hypothetical protein
MPIVYYVCWPEGGQDWRFETDKAAREFRREHGQGWDMVISPREEDDEPTDNGSGPQASDEQA